MQLMQLLITVHAVLSATCRSHWHDGPLAVRGCCSDACGQLGHAVNMSYKPKRSPWQSRICCRHQGAAAVSHRASLRGRMFACEQQKHHALTARPGGTPGNTHKQHMDALANNVLFKTLCCVGSAPAVSR